MRQGKWFSCENKEKERELSYEYRIMNIEFPGVISIYMKIRYSLFDIQYFTFLPAFPN